MWIPDLFNIFKELVDILAILHLHERRADDAIIMLSTDGTIEFMDKLVNFH